MNPRYFIGISLPPEINQHIEKIHELLSGEDAVMQPLVPHITLLHPNILMSISPIYLLPKIKSITGEILPIKIQLTSTAMFDKRVFYIEVISPDLHTIQKQLVELLPEHVKSSYQLGLSYTPHVTIAQANPRQNLSDSLIKQLETHTNKLLPFDFTCDSLSQFLQTKPRQYIIREI